MLYQKQKKKTNISCLSGPIKARKLKECFNNAGTLEIKCSAGYCLFLLLLYIAIKKKKELVGVSQSARKPTM